MPSIILLSTEATDVLEDPFAVVTAEDVLPAGPDAWIEPFSSEHSRDLDLKASTATSSGGKYSPMIGDFAW